MFGLYRVALAILVATQHLLSVPAVGDHALHGFFILSGFLMARVLCDVYGFSASGVRAFAVNRVLRLYPVYWVILIFSVGVILVFGEEAARQYRSFLYLPDSPASVVQNLSLIYPSWYPGLVEPRLSPPTWSLTVEILFYALMAAGAVRNRYTALVWLALSALYVSGMTVWGVSGRFYYAAILAQSLPFALGATLYHFQGQLGALYNRVPWLGQPVRVAAVLGLHSVTVAVLVMAGFGRIEIPGVFVNMALQLLLIASLSRLQSQRWRHPDRVLGDLTYPIFLLHWQVGFGLSMLIFGQPIRGLSANGVLLYGLTVVVSAGLALALLLLDKPVQRLRGRVRPRQLDQAPQPSAELGTGIA